MTGLRATSPTFSDLAQASALVAATSSRTEKAQAFVTLLREVDPTEAAILASYLVGELRQRRTGVGWASLKSIPDPATEPTLTLTQVDSAFAEMSTLSGPGSAAARKELLATLLSAATRDEQRLIAALVAGELRQGASDGVLLEAIALLAQVPVASVRSALTLAGSVPALAEAVAVGGREGLAQFALSPGRALKPMLAQAAPDVAAAIAAISPDSTPSTTGAPADAPAGAGQVGVEWKLDGVRVQVHRDGDEVHVFSRSLDDITARMPEIVEAVRALPLTSCVLDGEAIALDADRRPLPFQVTGSRVGQSSDVAGARARVPLSLVAFDALHIDGQDFIGLPGRERWQALADVVPEPMLIPRIVTDDPTVAAEFAAAALAAGHEGVVVKALDQPYQAGRRGAGWVKVKPRHTFDLVVIAAEWGHGRRTGWLSNVHLAAIDAAGEFGPAGAPVMLGKTFKGMTDAMLATQTEQLLALATGPTTEWVVPVRPEFVVEVAIDGLQTSRRYPAGITLRFARLLRHRPDKPATEADTIASLLALRATPASVSNPDPASNEGA